MAYIIEVPVDWLRVGAKIWVIEPKCRTQMDEDLPFRNTVKGFAENGVFYQHQLDMPVYFAEFTEVGKTVFETEAEANEALKKRNKK
jgi:hypothetical protein